MSPKNRLAAEMCPQTIRPYKLVRCSIVASTKKKPAISEFKSYFDFWVRNKNLPLICTWDSEPPQTNIHNVHDRKRSK